MFTIGQILRLKPDTFEEYKRRHDELWPEMIEVMNSFQINMAIYLYGELLFLFATAPDEKSWRALENHSITPRWDEYMSDVLERIEGDSYYVDVPCVFAFGEFALGASPKKKKSKAK